MALRCPLLATLCRLSGLQYRCIEAVRSNGPWWAPTPAAQAPQWFEAADTRSPGAENPQREGMCVCAVDPVSVPALDHNGATTSFCRVGGILAFTPYVHKCACGGQWRPVETTEQHLVWLFRPSLPFGFLKKKKKSLTWQKLTALVRLTNQEPPGFHLSPPPQLCLALLPNPLSVFLGMEVRSSSCRQLLYSPETLPQPPLSF